MYSVQCTVYIVYVCYIMYVQSSLYIVQTEKQENIMQFYKNY